MIAIFRPRITARFLSLQDHEPPDFFKATALNNINDSIRVYSL